jgi:biotin carboxyl carrier protein
MSDYEVTVGDRVVEPADGWELHWVDRGHGEARVTDATRSVLLVVEGGGTEWTVTLRGRRIRVSVRTWREQVLARADVEAAAHGGPLDVKATLPGLVLAVAAEEGSEVAEGDPLVTIEAMKMQNEVRAPRPGRIGVVAVVAGQTVAAGATLLRLE